MTPEETLAAILACDTDIVIRAGAGTGKTHTLVERYLTELTRRRDGELTRVDQLAAITFTEKAAEEMQERLRARLTKEIDGRLARWWGSRGGEPSERPSAANLEERIVAKSDEERILLHLIRQRQSLAGAYIATIHSFCARLLLENPVAAGVDPGYAGADEIRSTAMLKEAAREVALARLRQRDEGTVRLARRFGFGDEGRGAGLVPQVAALIPLLRAADADPATVAAVYEERRERLDAERRGALEPLARLAEAFAARKVDSKEEKAARMVLAIPALTHDLPLAYEEARAALGIAAYLQEKLNKPGKAPEELLAQIREMVACVRAASAPPLEAEAAPDVHALLSLAADARERYEAAKARHSLLDFDDLQERGLALLTGSPSALARYRKQFRRVMVDEYQDTNELQRRIVTTLAPPGEGRLLVVGDVKQSIYGFRGADVSVFARTEREVEAAGGQVFALRRNRRSAPGLLLWFNGLFGGIMNEGGDDRYLPSRDDLLPHRPPLADDPPTVERLATGGEKADDRRFIEAQTLASLIRRQVDGGRWRLFDKGTEVERPVRYADVAILLRAFTHVGLYEGALRHAGVPFTVVKGKGFYATSEIRDLTAALRWLVYRDDRLSYLSLLRSPFGGLSDGGLLQLTLNPKAPNLSDADRERFDRFHRMAHQWRRLAPRMTVSELIERLLTDSGYPAVTLARVHGEQRLANLLKLIEKARTFDRDGRGGLGDFLDLLDAAAEGEKEPQADLLGEEDTVRVMTIHQSKGLEFGVTLLADLGRAENHRSRQAPVLYHPHVGIGVKIFDETTGGWVQPPLFRQVAEAHTTFERQEANRLLYVAATRARDRLILSGSGDGPWRKNVDEASLTPAPLDPEAFPPVAAERGEATPAVVTALFGGWVPEAPPPAPLPPPPRPDIGTPVTGLSTFIRCPRLYYYATVARLDADDTDQPTGGDGIQGGIEGHRLMERLPLIPFPDRKSVTGAIDARFPRQPAPRRKQMADDLWRAFASPPLAALAHAEPDALFREAPLTFRVQDERVSLTLTGAIDLLYFADGMWRVVDYKFSRRPADEGRYRTQVALYALGWSMASGADAIEGGVVYLREPGEQGTLLPLGETERAAVRQRALDAALGLAALQGAPAEAWEAVADDRCGECLYRERCGGGL